MRNRKFTIDQYREMAKRFNKMSFKDKIKTIKENQDILTIGSDLNWFAVLVKDEEIQEKLYFSETGFEIENEWNDNHIRDLIDLLEIQQTGL